MSQYRHNMSVMAASSDTVASTWHSHTSSLTAHNQEYHVTSHDHQKQHNGITLPQIGNLILLTITC